MIGPLQNAMRLQALRATGGREVTRVAVVTGYDPNAYAAQVNVLPDEISSGWLPIASPWIGNGWGLFLPPNIGDMVSVSFFEGHLEAGYVELRFWNSIDLPVAVPSGEFWLLHKSGSLMKFTNDGKVAVTSHSDLNVTVGGNLNANVTGNVSARVSGSVSANVTGNVNVTAPTLALTGNLTVSGTIVAQGEVTGNGKHLSTHTHSGVTSGSSNTGPPT